MKKHYSVNLFSIYMMIIIMLSACVSSKPTDCIDCLKTPQKNYRNHICHDASAFRGEVIGDGHCVSFIKYCSDVPNTDQWQAGEYVWQNDIQPGSIIATFKNGRYPNTTGYHAAIYIEQDSNGIWVWDQWQGKAVHKRLIPWRDNSAFSNTSDGNRAQSYQTVLSIHR